jgi:hypothetical protein
MCFFMAVSDMPNGSASSLIVALPAPSRSRTARRVGSARAAKVRSTVRLVPAVCCQFSKQKTMSRAARADCSPNGSA